MEKVLIAEFGLGTGLHMDYQTLLLNNDIEFDSTMRTDYDEGFAMEIMSFYVKKIDIEKSILLKNKILSEHQGHKTYPKFVKIFIVMFLIISAAVIASYFIVDYFDLAYPSR